MTSIPLSARATSSGHLRPLNILRDLPKVADLIELCFSENMDSEGRTYVQQMRRAGRDSSFLRWANQAVESASMPLTGYVWEEMGRIVGNVSLVPFSYKGQRIYLIANVATHPDFRRQGIASMLTEQVMELARQRNASGLWLHVRADNPGAVQMYTELGFEERARRTTWHAPATVHQTRTYYLPPVIQRHSRFWPQQQAWLEQLHPAELSWYRSNNWNALKPGLWQWVYRFFVEFDLRQWAVQTDGKLQGVLSFVPSMRGSSLWLAAAQNSEPDAITSLLVHARLELRHVNRLVLEHPVGIHNEAIRAADFTPRRTLIWMRAK